MASRGERVPWNGWSGATSQAMCQCLRMAGLGYLQVLPVCPGAGSAGCSHLQDKCGVWRGTPTSGAPFSSVPGCPDDLVYMLGVTLPPSGHTSPCPDLVLQASESRVPYFDIRGSFCSGHCPWSWPGTGSELMPQECVEEQRMKPESSPHLMFCSQCPETLLSSQLQGEA